MLDEADDGHSCLSFWTKKLDAQKTATFSLEKKLKIAAIIVHLGPGI
jgi:hypothetical protein